MVKRLLLVTIHTDLIFSMSNHLTFVDKIYSYNAKKDKWKKLTDISHLQITHAITVAQNKLTISEEVSNPKNPDEPEINPVCR